MVSSVLQQLSSGNPAVNWRELLATLALRTQEAEVDKEVHWLLDQVSMCRVEHTLGKLIGRGPVSWMISLPCCLYYLLRAGDGAVRLWILILELTFELERHGKTNDSGSQGCGGRVSGRDKKVR